MDVASDATPLPFEGVFTLQPVETDPRFELLPQTNDPDQSKRHHETSSGFKPPRLPDEWLDGDPKSLSVGIPNAIIIARGNVEGITAIRDVVVSNRSQRLGTRPIRVEPFQFVPEHDFLRRGKAESG